MADEPQGPSPRELLESLRLIEGSDAAPSHDSDVGLEFRNVTFDEVWAVGYTKVGDKHFKIQVTT